MLEINGKSYSIQDLTYIVTKWEEQQSNIKKAKMNQLLQQRLKNRRVSRLPYHINNNLTNAIINNVDCEINKIIEEYPTFLQSEYFNILVWAIDNNRNNTLKLLIDKIPDGKVYDGLPGACFHKNSTAIKMILDNSEPPIDVLVSSFKIINDMKTHREKKFYIDIFLERDKLKTIKALKSASMNYKEYVNV